MLGKSTTTINTNKSGIYKAGNNENTVVDMAVLKSALNNRNHQPMLQPTQLRVPTIKNVFHAGVLRANGNLKWVH